MALAKSIDKLLLAASASKACLIVVTLYFMFAFGLLYVRFQANLCLQFSIGMAQGGAIIRVGIKWPLLTSGMRPLDRYGTHQETISRRPEQMYSPSDTGLGMA